MCCCLFVEEQNNKALLVFPSALLIHLFICWVLSTLSSLTWAFGDSLDDIHHPGMEYPNVQIAYSIICYRYNQWCNHLIIPHMLIQNPTFLLLYSYEHLFSLFPIMVLGPPQEKSPVLFCLPVERVQNCIVFVWKTSPRGQFVVDCYDVLNMLVKTFLFLSSFLVFVGKVWLVYGQCLPDWWLSSYLCNITSLHDSFQTILSLDSFFGYNRVQHVFCFLHNFPRLVQPLLSKLQFHC